MAQSKYSYIPPSIQRAMDQQLQRMPANLQKYQSGNSYIPSHAAKSMESYMNKSMPGHMKEYIKPYMQQKVTAGLNSLDPVRTSSMQARAPVPNLMRRDHSSVGAQFTVNVDTNNQSRSHKSLSFAPQYSPNQSGTPPAPPPAPMSNANPYDFIMNSGQKSRRGLGGSSMKQRILLVSAGFGLLLIAAVILFSIIGSNSNSNVQNLVKLAQQQTEIARVAAIGVDKAGSNDTKNLAITTKLSMQTSANNTVALLKKSGHKLNTKTLALLQNSQIDKQLGDAASANTFDDAFTKIIKTELINYRIALQNDFKVSTKNSEKQLLQQSFNNATILIGDKKS